MIEHYIARPVVHLGAGALGRGLILPILVQNGADPVLVDTDGGLVEALGRAGDYRLRVGPESERIPVGAVFTPADPALAHRLRDARLITVSVRHANLAAAAEMLAACWSGSTGRHLVVGCENVAASSQLLRDLVIARGVAPDRVIAADCVVDRICASRWPRDLDIETELHLEWAIAGNALAGIAVAETVADLAPRFARKRYLVNAFADAAAFLGQARGCRTLQAAAADEAVIRDVEPLLEALRRLLARRDGFTPAALVDYQASSRQRLADPAIARPIETVARDLWRKLGANERFVEPMRSLIELGESVEGAIDTLARLLSAQALERSATLNRLQSEWPAAEWSRALLAGLARAWRRSVEPAR